MDNSVVVLEHVDFIDVLKSLHTELLDCGVQFLVLVDLFLVDNLLNSSLGS